MLCHFRTIGAGIGVVALCFMLAWLSWQFVLAGFALASIAWACYSCSNQLRPRKREAKLPPALVFDATRRRRRAQPPENLYSFPGQEYGGTSILN